MATKRKVGMIDQLLIDPVKLRVLSDPVRSFVVYSLVAAAKTVKQLALELDCPPTRLYYHMQQLQKHGLVFVERTRTVSGIVEKHYRAAAREFVLDRSAFGRQSGLDPRRRDALLAFVFDQTRQEIARELDAGRIDLQRRAPEVGALMAYRNVLKLDQAQAARLYSRLLAFWNEYDEIAKQPAVDGHFYAFTVALYPNDMRPGSDIEAVITKPAAKRTARRKGQ